MYGVEDKLLAISFSFIMLLNAAGVRSIAGTFLIPAGIFSLSWFSFTLIPLVILFSVPINSLTILYILSSVFVFSLSALPFDWQKAVAKNKSKSLADAKFDSRFLRICLYLSVFSSISLSVISMIINGFTINNIIFNLIATSGQYAATRGVDGFDYGLIGVLSILFTYLSPLLGGLRSFASRKKWFFVLSMSPSLIVMITQSSKLVFLISLCFYLAGVIVTKIYSTKLTLMKISSIGKIAILTILLFPLILVSFVSRLGVSNLNEIGSISEPLLFSIYSYTVGQIYAYSEFFSYTINVPQAAIFADDYYSLGGYTFASVFDMLGIGKKFPPGMFAESSGYKTVFNTNIFTFFRGLIYDFGVLGSLIFIFIFGLFSHAITYRIFTKPRAWFSLAILISIIVFIFLGYLFSVFVARFMFLNAAVVWILLSINTRLNRIPHQQFCR